MYLLLIFWDMKNGICQKTILNLTAACSILRSTVRASEIHGLTSYTKWTRNRQSCHYRSLMHYITHWWFQNLNSALTRFLCSYIKQEFHLGSRKLQTKDNPALKVLLTQFAGYKQAKRSVLLQTTKPGSLRLLKISSKVYADIFCFLPWITCS